MKGLSWDILRPGRYPNRVSPEPGWLKLRQRASWCFVKRKWLLHHHFKWHPEIPSICCKNQLGNYQQGAETCTEYLTLWSICCGTSNEGMKLLTAPLTQRPIGCLSTLIQVQSDKCKCKLVFSLFLRFASVWAKSSVHRSSKPFTHKA